MTSRAAFEELPSYERILGCWEASHQRWQDIKTNRVATELMLQAGKR